MANITNDWEKAVDVILNGGVVAFPTDTIYCLAADALNSDAIRQVYRIKQRPLDKAIPIFISDSDALTAIAVDVSVTANSLIEHMWPGALTIVFRLNPAIETLAAGGGNTIAVRIPDHEIARNILSQTKLPLSGTSANLSGGPNPVTADEVYRQIGDMIDMIVDGGPCPGTVASTIVDLTGDKVKIIRYGAISKEDIEKACGIRL